jgi:hypothetical protein
MTKHGLNLKGFIRQFQINTTLASDAILEKPEGYTAKQIMDSILNRNIGKVIYIDC